MLKGVPSAVIAGVGVVIYIHVDKAAEGWRSFLTNFEEW